MRPLKGVLDMILGYFLGDGGVGLGNGLGVGWFFAGTLFVGGEGVCVVVCDGWGGGRE